ncbi:6979_t:CDS:2 [Funneliformis caledonium]|uniref:6979_t:CDS:1 n=1 Tax=Funneliformis caledonium TaxID=1117310 RepID=A0A9N9DGX4_9GLOM|nr:6979_t:CDS:2 [Funneliformis caledonium]
MSLDNDTIETLSETSRLLDENFDEGQETWLEKFRSQRLLWMLPFSLTLSIIMSSTMAPLVQLIFELVCQEFKEQKQKQNLLFDDECNLPEIHVNASNYIMWYTTLLNVAVTLSTGYFSTLSDYLGRKFVFKLSTVGLIFALANLLIVAHFWKIVGIKFLFVGSVIEGLLGGIITINTACHAYLSDCTSSENRSVAFSLMHATAYCGMSIGPTLGGLIIKATGSILSIFYIAICALIIFLIVVTLILPESVSPSMRDQNLLISPHTSMRHIVSPLTVLRQIPVGIEENNWKGRNTLYILAVIYFFYKISQAAQNEIVNLYTKYKFHWTSLENGYFLSLQSFTRLIALILLVPLLHLIRLRYNPNNSRSLDIWTMRGGLIMEIIGFILFALAISPDWFYFACVINSLATITSPAMRSLFTTFVLPNQSGQVLGAISVIESVGSILSPLWMNQLYSWGIVNGISEIVFWVNTGIFIISFFLSTLI